jgi:hypothetical protein
MLLTGRHGRGCCAHGLQFPCPPARHVLLLTTSVPVQSAFAA